MDTINKAKTKLRVVMMPIKKSTSMNYEELKNYLKYEDIFYEHILIPVAKENGVTISFSGDKVIFKK